MFLVAFSPQKSIKTYFQILEETETKEEDVSNVELLSTELDKVEVSATMTPESDETTPPPQQPPTETPTNGEIEQEEEIIMSTTEPEQNPLDADPVHDKLLLTRGQDFDLGKL